MTIAPVRRPTHDEMLAACRQRKPNIYQNDQAVMRHVFLNMGHFYPQAIVDVGSSRRSLTGRVTNEDDRRWAGFAWGEPSGSVTLAEYVADVANMVDGIAIAHRGRIVFERYPAMLGNQRHICWSVTKVLVGLCVARFAARGAVALDRPVADYVAELRTGDWGGATVRDLLDMASGMDAREDADAFMDPAHPYYGFEASLGYVPGGTGLSTYAYVAGLRRRIPPGTAYEYTSVNTFVLAWILERVAEAPFAAILENEVWRHAGTASVASITVSPHGAPSADGGISMTLADMVRIGLLYTPAGGAWAARVLPDGHLRAIRSDGRPDLFAAGEGSEALAEQDPPRCSSWQWDRVWEDGDMFKSGWGGQGLYVSPMSDLVVAFFGCPGPSSHRNALPRIARQLSVAIRGDAPSVDLPAAAEKL